MTYKEWGTVLPQTIDTALHSGISFHPTSPMSKDGTAIHYSMATLNQSMASA
jgi:hypothetical protein